MKKVFLFGFTAFLMVFTSACKITSATEGQDKSVRVCRNTTKLILNTYSDLKIPDSFRTDAPKRTATDFQIATLLDELDFVKVNERFQIDYVYSYHNSVGFPLPYTLPIEKANFQTEDDFKTKKHYPLTYGIETDSSNWGFLQLAIVEEIGGQFYQYFEAGYDDTLVICDIDDIESLIDRLSTDEVHQPFDWWQKMRALTISETDPSVTIRKGQNEVDVSILIFDHDIGIVRRTFTYTYGFPHMLKNIQDDVVVEYQCDTTAAKEK